MSEKRKSASPSGIQIKNWWKIIGIEEKLHVINWREKGERIVDICCNVRLAHSSLHTIRNNAARIQQSVTSGTEVFV
jgi:hypothetical protein